jgi:trigger factor
MSCTITVDGPCRRTLSFSIDRSELEAAIEQRVTEVARQSSFKGFRPGHAPLSLVKKTHGKQITEDARQAAMSKAFEEAIKEHSLSPVGEPEMNLEKLNDEGDGPFTFELTIEIAPEFELQEIDRIAVTVPVPPVTDEMVEGEMQHIRQQGATLEDAAEGSAIGPESILGTTIVYVVDGEELEARPDRPVLLKHDIVDGFPCPGAADAFSGKAIGDTVELSAELPAHFEPKESAGSQATLRVTIDTHRVMNVPPISEELLSRAGVKDEDELRMKVRERLDGQRARFREEQVDRAVEAWLIEKHPLELPERMTEKAIERRVHEYAHQLVEQQGLDSEAGHHQAEERREEIADATRRSLHASFILSRIANAQKLGAGAEDVQAEIGALAKMHNQDPKELLETSVKEGWINDVAMQVTDTKTRKWLRERTDVTEAELTPAEPQDAAAGS